MVKSTLLLVNLYAVAALQPLLQPVPPALKSTAKFFSGSADDPLQEWLKHISFTIPDQEIDAKGFDLTLTNFTCNGIVIDDMNSAYAPSSLVVDLTGVGVGCSLSVHVKGLLSTTIGAALTVSKAALHASLSDTRSSDGMPATISIGKCELDLPIDGLQIVFAKSSIAGAVREPTIPSVPRPPADFVE
jgi:hypothetical protein